MRFVFFLFATLCSCTVMAQDLTGIWRGHFKSSNFSRLLDSLGIEDRYKFETQISQSDKAFQGVTYSYKTTVFYGKASCVGTISKKTKKVILGENKLLEVKSADGGACLMTCFLQYSKVGNEEFLEGTYTSISVRDSTQCGGGTVFLRKVTTSDFYKEPFLADVEKSRPPQEETKITPKPPVKKDPPLAKAAPSNQAPANRKPAVPRTAKPPATQEKPRTLPKKQPELPKKQPDLVNKSEAPKTVPTDTLKKEVPTVSAPVPIPRVLTTRRNELVKTIASSAREVTINIYDNGTIDNDTVSVYVNNKLVISRQRLTAEAITVTINLDDDREYHELVMVAENLGEIPPNTSLMVVKAGDEQHEVRITSNEQKNAVVRFKKK